MGHPIWKGKIAKCPYCKDGIYPHTHADWDEGSEADEKPPKAPRKSKATDTATKTATGRRGRPMKPENAELLRLCDCV
jgi:hypothetical protein